MTSSHVAQTAFDNSVLLDPAQMKKKDLIKRWHLAENAPLVALAERALTEKEEVSNADLRGLFVGVDGALPEFLYEAFIDGSLTDVDLSFANLSCSFANVRLIEVTMAEVKFDTCSFDRGYFERCVFAKAHIDSPWLDDAEFTGCDFEHTKLRGRGFGEYGGRRVTFTSCRFVGTNFTNLQFRATRFNDCEFTDVSFNRCYFAGVAFKGASPPRESFTKCEFLQCEANGNIFA